MIVRVVVRPSHGVARLDRQGERREPVLLGNHDLTSGPVAVRVRTGWDGETAATTPREASVTDVAETIAFYAIGGLTIVSAVLVVSLRNIFHAVLALVVAFVGIAGLYITLNAGSGGNETFAVINGANQIITASGDVRITRRG